MKILHANITTATFGLINPIPIAFFIDHKAAIGKLLPNLNFLAIIVSYVFLRSIIPHPKNTFFIKCALKCSCAEYV